MKLVTCVALLLALVAVARGQDVGAPEANPPSSGESNESNESNEGSDEAQTTAQPSAQPSAEPSAQPSADNSTDGNSTGGAGNETEPAYQVGYQGAWAITYNIQACEAVVVKMSCPKFHYIYIYSVFWGRADSDTCKRDTGNLDLRCENEFAVNVIRDRCDGQTDCQFVASADNFGTMCNTPKYLNVEYQCYAPLYHALMCQESGYLELHCPEGKYLEIQDGFWGRSGTSTCPHPNIVDTDCNEPNAYAMIAEMCDGKSSCSLDAHTDYFGNPCLYTVKYLRADYTCAECLNAWESDADCEFWAAEGECKASSGWMLSNCRRTCWKCGTEEQDAASCINDKGDDVCEGYAADGECEKNPVWMHAYCKKSCVKCDNLTPCRNLHDDTRCDEYATSEVGQCKDNVYWMHQHCAKSCWGCEKSYIECKDSNTMCETWANQDECQHNPGYMIPYCTKSCTGCVSDPVCTNDLHDEASCEYWASIGECERNAAYMYKKCWKSCMACGDVAPCINWYGDDVQCEIWKSEGQCQNNMAWMTAFCKQTCMECDLKCTNMMDDSYCDAQAARGQCELNPIWMHQKCLKSCQKCDDPLKCENKQGDAICDYWANTGECNANPGWMYLNCRLSCTRCGPLNNVHSCMDLNGNCTNWANDNQCAENPWYMIPTCRMSCTGCNYKSIYVQDTLHRNPVHVGGQTIPGDTAVITRGSTLLMPDRIKSYGRLMNINAFFVSTAPVHFQIWRYNSTGNSWSTVYDELVTPDHSNTAQTQYASHPCVQVWTGDYLGFTTFGNVAPIAATLNVRNVFRTTMFHDAGTDRGFVKLGLPYDFSYGADFDLDATCN